MRCPLLTVTLSVAACAPPAQTPRPPVDTDDAVDSDSGTADDRPVAFADPADAMDLDPNPAVLRVALVAERYTYAWGDEVLDGVAYNQQVPGPTLRAKLGDRLVVDLENWLDEPTTIHWHGLSVPWAMDGITWMQDPIDPGETFTYEFELSEPGTFWYHPHFNGGLGQVDLGLYGAIVVTDPADPPLQDVVLVFDAGAEEEADEHHAPPAATAWTVNGAFSPRMELPPGTAVRARLVNASSQSYLDLRWPGARQIGGDHGLLSAAGDASALLLGPGDRAEIELAGAADEVTVTGAPYTLAGGSSYGEPFDVLTIAADATEPPEPIDWRFDGAAPTEDPTYSDIVWVFSGDGGTWKINGETWPGVPVEEVTYGDTAIIEVRNLSATEHPFHLHGMPFEVLSIDGVPPLVRRTEDTINLPIRSTVRLRVVATNAGDWMAHCHILPHAHDGMMTVFRVTSP